MSNAMLRRVHLRASWQKNVVYPLRWDGVAMCSVVGSFFYTPPGGGSVASYTPVQHTYPGNPLPQPCWISQFFDHVTNGKTHRAQDVDYYNSNNNGGLATPYGTPVYAAEGGQSWRKLQEMTRLLRAILRVQANVCEANYVKIQGSEGY